METLIINKYWWKDEEGNDVTEETHSRDFDFLVEHAEERITEMSNQDYYSGELLMETEDHYYHGWWQHSKETIENKDDLSTSGIMEKIKYAS